MKNKNYIWCNMEINQQEIIDKLKEKGALLPCHRCGNKQFTVIDGYSNFSLKKNIDLSSSITIGGPNVPIILIACDKCGAITPHAMGALNLLPKGEQKNG